MMWWKGSGYGCVSPCVFTAPRLRCVGCGNRRVHCSGGAPHLARCCWFEAAARFDVPATTLSMFIVVQLLVYAGAQIPVGMALDKLGARRLIAVGALLMGLGQFGMAFAESVPVALAARVLIGAGDATTFVSVLKIIAAWFPPRRAPLLGQITGQIAQLGQIISAVPFVVLLHGTSWPVAFSVLGIVGFAAFTWVLTWVRDAPRSRQPQQPECGYVPLTLFPHLPMCALFAGRFVLRVRGWVSGPTWSPRSVLTCSFSCGGTRSFCVARNSAKHKLPPSSL